MSQNRRQTLDNSEERVIAQRCVGRPRSFTSADLADLVNELSDSERRAVSVPELIGAAVARMGCSRRTAYRALHRACDEEVLSAPGFGPRRRLQLPVPEPLIVDKGGREYVDGGV